jgi:hypothetical protein
MLGPGLLTYIRPVLYPTDQAQFLVLSNLLLEQRPAVFFWATACGLGGVFLIVTARKEAWGPFVGCMTALMVISLFFVQKFDVYFANHYSFKPFVKRVLPTINDAPLYFYLSDDYGVIFYTGRRVPKLDTESLPRDNSPYYLFVWEKQWEQFTNEDGLSLVAAVRTRPFGERPSLWCRSQSQRRRAKSRNIEIMPNQEGLAPVNEGLNC